MRTYIAILALFIALLASPFYMADASDVHGVDVVGGVVTGSTIDDTTIGATTAQTGKFTTLEATGAVVFNDAGADVDFKAEGDTDTALLHVNAGSDSVGIGTSSPDTTAGVKLQAHDSAGAGLVLSRDDTEVTAGDRIGGIHFKAFDSSTDGTKIKGEMDLLAETTFTSSIHKTAFRFRTAEGVALPATAMVLDSDANLIIGKDNIATHDGADTSAVNVLQLHNGTPPAAAVAGATQIYSKDSSDGATNATLAIETEQAIEVVGTFTPSHKLQIWINGVEYHIQLDAI